VKIRNYVEAAENRKRNMKLREKSMQKKPYKQLSSIIVTYQ